MDVKNIICRHREEVTKLVELLLDYICREEDNKKIIRLLAFSADVLSGLASKQGD